MKSDFVFICLNSAFYNECLYIPHSFLENKGQLNTSLSAHSDDRLRGPGVVDGSLITFLSGQNIEMKGGEIL